MDVELLTWLCSLVTSQTTTNCSSLYPWKNVSLISWTTERADTPLGTWQFSMSQNTPIGGLVVLAIGAEELKFVPERDHYIIQIRNLQILMRNFLSLIQAGYNYILPLSRSRALLSEKPIAGLITTRSGVVMEDTNCWSLVIESQTPCSAPCETKGRSTLPSNSLGKPMFTAKD
jgi:hypothetical protein